jgi:predicted dehydrogenase
VALIRTGLLGFGYWGENLLRVMHETEGMLPVSVWDPDASRVALAQKRYPSLSTEMTNLDALVIATPLAHHYQGALAALRENKHVLLAKPATNDSFDAQHLAEIAAGRNLVLMIDHTFNFTAAVRRLSALREELGKLLYVHSERVNLGVFRHDCDVIWDLAPHDFSILGYVLKEWPTEVLCVAEDLASTGIANAAWITAWYESGLVAHVHVNWLSPVKIRRMIFAGDAKMAVYDDLEPSEKIRVYDSGVELTKPGAIRHELVQYRRGDVWSPRLNTREALSVMMEHFVHSIVTGTTPITNGEHALQVVKVLEAATRSAREERKVAV